MLSEWLFVTTEYIALVATSMSGALVAIGKRLDLIGVWFLSLVASFGGGVLRDLLLGNTPPHFFTHYHCLLTVTLVSLAVFIIAKHWKGFWRPYVRRTLNNVHNLLDAIGLAAFTISGVQLALAAGHTDNLFLCAFMGVITGVGGGVIRDLMVMEMPGILHKRVYAVASIVGAVLYWVGLRYQMPEEAAWAISMVSIIAIRICATVFRWNMPRVAVPEEAADHTEQIKEKETIKK